MSRASNLAGFTTSIGDDGIVLTGVSSVGIATSNPRSVLDLSGAGSTTGGFVLLPNASTARRNVLPQIKGAFLFNEQLGRLEIYDGNGWVGIATTT